MVPYFFSFYILREAVQICECEAGVSRSLVGGSEVVVQQKGTIELDLPRLNIIVKHKISLLSLFLISWETTVAGFF